MSVPMTVFVYEHYSVIQLLLIVYDFNNTDLSE